MKSGTTYTHSGTRCLVRSRRRKYKTVLLCSVAGLILLILAPRLYDPVANTSATMVTGISRVMSCPEGDNKEITKSCPVLPEQLGLVGQLLVNTTAPTWAELERMFPDVQPGGRWRPRDCLARSRVQIVVPYRDRDYNLRALLKHMHDFLPRQKLDYVIIIAEQAGNTTFNRGMMRNIGFMEGGIYDHYDCTVFNDLDLLPENDHNTYGCPDFPKHLCVSLDYYEYEPLANQALFGGVVAFRNDHFKLINGYSNFYFGWGGEDDDLQDRCLAARLGFYRTPITLGRYTGVPHPKEPAGNTTRDLFLHRKGRMSGDGLNSLRYRVVKRKRHPLYTWVLAEVDEKLYRSKADNYLSTVREAEAQLTEAEKKNPKRMEQLHNRAQDINRPFIASDPGPLIKDPGPFII